MRQLSARHATKPPKGRRAHAASAVTAARLDVVRAAAWYTRSQPVRTFDCDPSPITVSVASG
jgi:hypothetical protein